MQIFQELAFVDCAVQVAEGFDAMIVPEWAPLRVQILESFVDFVSLIFEVDATDIGYECSWSGRLKEVSLAKL